MPEALGPAQELISARSAGLDDRRPLQCAVHRAFVGDLHQLVALFVAQIPLQPHHAGELVGLGVAAAVGILRMHLVMADIDAHVIERLALAPGIHADRHRGAGP